MTSRNRLRWATLPALVLLAATISGQAPAAGKKKCTIGSDSCPGDDNGDSNSSPPPRGTGHPSGGSSGGGSSGPPPSDSRVASCTANPAFDPTCNQILATDINRQRTYNVALTRNMFKADKAGYPDNLASATTSNLLPHPGVASNADPATTQLTSNTELAYHSMLVFDWASYKGGSLSATRSLRFSSNDQWSYSEVHPWLKPRVVGNNWNHALSCQEYAWRKWSSQSLPYTGPSPTLDNAALCGNNVSCVMNATFFDASSPFYSGDSTVAVQASPARASTNVPVSYRQNVAVVKNPFYGLNVLMLFDQNIATQQAWVDRGAAWNTCPMQGPFMPPSEGNVAQFFVPTKYAGQNAAAKVSAIVQQLQNPPVYLIGNPSSPTPPGAVGSTVAGQYANERAMIADLWSRRTIHGQQVPYYNDDPFEVATRERITRFRDLLELYQQLTQIDCNIPRYPGSSPSGSGSGGGGSWSGGGGSGGAGNGGGGPVHVTPTFTMPGAHALAVKAQSAAAPKVAESGSTLQDVIAAAAVVQDEIVTMMLDEYDRGDDGCFSANQTMCDVDPYEVTGRVLRSFDAAQEADFQTCVAWTANQLQYSAITDIDALIYGKIQANRRALMTAPGIDPTHDGTAVPTMDARMVHMDTGAPVVREAIGQIVTGSRYMGDRNLVGGGYQYGAYWKVTPSDFTGPNGSTANGTACELDGEVHGELHGRVDLLRSVAEPICSGVDLVLDGLAGQGKGFDDPAVKGELGNLNQVPLVGDVVSFCDLRYRMRHLADAYLTASARPGTGSYGGSMFFGGAQMWSAQGAGALPNISASWPASPIEIQGPSMTVVIVIVPVTFELNGEIQYGADGLARVDSVKGCNKGNPQQLQPSMEAHAAFTPWVTVDAIGSAAIGFSFAQAGVRGKVRALDARLPFDTFARIAPDASQQLALQAGAHANLHLAMLGGSLSAFAEINIPPFDEEVEQQLASWDGLHPSPIGILNYDLTPIELPTFDQNTWTQFQTTTQQQ